MRVWFDTEFLEDGKTIELISVGLVREDGATYYAETPEARWLCNRSPWLVDNVLPHLSGEPWRMDSADELPRPVTRARAEIVSDIVSFVGDAPEFWAYYADYDWVVLCQLYGRMIDLPKGWPMYCRDLKQEADRQGTALPSFKHGAAHNALADALECRDRHLWLLARDAASEKR